MSEMRIRAESSASFFERARAAGRRIDAGDSSRQADELSFESVETLFRVLTPNRWAMLAKLRTLGPSSIRALAKALGRDYRGVHADVVALLGIGLIDRDSDNRISVPWSKITAELAVDEAA
jgi:predicted transcriptional regulator